MAWTNVRATVLGCEQNRVKQIKETAKKKPAQPEPNCCVQKGFYWDDAILYPPQKRWSDEPQSKFWNGPVVRIIEDLEAIANQQR